MNRAVCSTGGLETVRTRFTSKRQLSAHFSPNDRLQTSFPPLFPAFSLIISVFSMVLPVLPPLPHHRVVITGLGLLTPLGTNVLQSWQHLCTGKTAIRALTATDDSAIPSLDVRIAGKLPSDFDYERWIQAVPYAKNRLNAYATAVTSEALENAGWKPDSDWEKHRSGVIFGSSFGCLSTILANQSRVHSKGFGGMDRFAMLKALTNLAAGHLSIQFKLKGPTSTVNTASASSQTAIGEAYHLIRRGAADVMVAGGAEEGTHPFLLAGFSKIGALNSENNGNPESASRPFDGLRKGVVLGEGAGAVVLEELEHALARKAEIYAEIQGFGTAVDAEYMTKPSEDGDGAYRAMQAAMRQADIQDIDHIKAHGTGSEEGDIAELTAIFRLFRSPGPIITAHKGSIGHLLGAAGVVECAFAALSIQQDTVPPIVNMTQPLELYSGTLKPNYARSLLRHKVNTVLCNSFGFGGVNTSLLLSKYK